MIKDDLSSFQRHSFRIGKLCFLTCEYAKWFIIIYASKTQLWSYLMAFGLFFRFYRVSRHHLNFQNLFIRTNINLIFVFILKLWFSKNPCENMGSCFFWERKKGKTPKNSWCSGFVSKKCVQYVICIKAHNEHRQIHHFINRKGSFDRRKSCGIMS